MGKVLRSILAVFAGIVVAGVAVVIVEMAGHAVFPIAAGTDFSSPDAIGKAIASGAIPTGAFAALVAAWGFGAFAGALAAAACASRAKLTHGMVFGGLFLLVTLFNLLMIPHPVWVWVLGLAAIPPAAYLGAWLAKGRPKAPQAEAVPGLA
jgi:hypothetical protein